LGGDASVVGGKKYHALVNKAALTNSQRAKYFFVIMKEKKL
tara:strand:- start:187 stop:309 length:123 start_codon:yes stop_codon:yes gene_type:complete